MTERTEENRYGIKESANMKKRQKRLTEELPLFSKEGMDSSVVESITK